MKQTKQEILDKIEELKQKVLELDKEEEGFVKVPDIKFVNTGGNTLGLVFNHDKATVYYYISDKIWLVDSVDKNYLSNVKVRKEPTPVDELEVGKWYVVSDYDFEPHVKDRERFKLYLGGCEYVKVSDSEGVEVHDCNWKYWHEVVVDED